MKLKWDHWLPKLLDKLLPQGCSAITIGSTIYVVFEQPQSAIWFYLLVQHEMVHVLQYKQYGIIGFLFVYTWQFVKEFVRCWDVRKAYFNIPFERAGYLAQNHPVLPETKEFVDAAVQSYWNAERAAF